MTSRSKISRLVRDIRACRECASHMPHEPRPIVQISATARIGIFGQAPGNLAHREGRPFTDPSGVRLRAWMGIDEAAFYDAAKVAIVPMAFCFPGYAPKGGDLPPRAECARLWRQPVMDALGALDVVLLVGGYAQRWHLGKGFAPTLTETVARWREAPAPYLPLPHPSWRNNAWIKRHPWFEAELLPELKARVRAALQD